MLKEFLKDFFNKGFNHVQIEHEIRLLDNLISSGEKELNDVQKEFAKKFLLHKKSGSKNLKLVYSLLEIHHRTECIKRTLKEYQFKKDEFINKLSRL